MFIFADINHHVMPDLLIVAMDIASIERQSVMESAIATQALMKSMVSYLFMRIDS